MASVIEFKKEAVEQAEQDFSRLQLHPAQRRNVEQMCGVISSHIGLSPLATKGFFWKALKEWQVKNKKPAEIIVKVSPEERAKIVKEVYGIMEEKYLANILKHFEDRRKLHEAMEAAYQYFYEHFYENAT